MRLAVSPLLLATVLLAGCASSADKDFKRNVAEANFKLGIGYMQSGHLEVAAEKLLKALADARAKKTLVFKNGRFTFTSF